MRYPSNTSLPTRERSVHDALDELKRDDAFQIDENLGVAFLFKKLLSEPLEQNSQEVYIIVDGIDEANFTANDRVIRKQPEMEILINCLTSLPAVRLLFLSRPIAAKICSKS